MAFRSPIHSPGATLSGSKPYRVDAGNGDQRRLAQTQKPVMAGQGSDGSAALRACADGGEKSSRRSEPGCGRIIRSVKDNGLAAVEQTGCRIPATIRPFACREHDMGDQGRIHSAARQARGGTATRLAAAHSYCPVAATTLR